MARLRNRQLKADFWTDPELLRWPRDKRWTYQGLWEMAEDSGCIEDDPFGWKLMLWPSPMDSDITVELLTEWRDELVEAHKAVPYEADGKHYLYLRTFHEHELPRNPQSPNLPLPAWVKWSPDKDTKERSRGRYVIDKDILLSQYCDANVSPVLSCPVLLNPLPLMNSQTVAPEVEKLIILAAATKSAKASWKPKQSDIAMFATLLERFPAVQVKMELQKFQAYALTKQWTKLPRAFVNWMNRVEPELRVEPRNTFPSEPPPEITDEDRAASLAIIRETRQRLARMGTEAMG